MDDRLRPDPDSSRRGPSSPGKRRMVDNEKGKVRLISRGLPDYDEEDNQQQVVINHPQIPAPAKERRVLDLSASRKRKTVEPSTGEQTVLVLPSPTTQIARQIDQIRLAGTPVYGYAARLPMLGMDQLKGWPPSGAIGDGEPSRTVGNQLAKDKDVTMQDMPGSSYIKDTGTPVMKPSSPQGVPHVATNVEVSDESVMERYLQRPQHALNMKRTMSGVEDEDREDIDEGQMMGDVDSSGGRKEKMVKYAHVSSRSNSQTPPIRVPTIVRSVSSPTREPVIAFSPPKDSNRPPSRQQQQHQLGVSSSSPSSGGFIIVPMALSTPTAVSSTLSSSSSSPTYTPAVSSSTSLSFSSVPRPQPQSSKVSNFSISELLGKNDSRPKSPKPIAQPFPAIPPSFLTLYYQQWYMQMLSNMKRFQGEPSEADSGPSRTGTSSAAPLLVVPDRDKTNGSPVSSVHSPSNEVQSPASLISQNSSHCTSSPNPENDKGTASNDGGNSNNPSITGRQPFVHNGDLDRGGSENGEEGENNSGQRQNALLQVSEAHLAILPDEDGDTPLHLSIIQENIPLTFYLVRLICGVRMNLDIANNLRQTPLHLSVITRQPMLCHLLVQNGASVNFPDRRGNTSVHLAAQRKSLDALQILSQATNPLPDFNCRNFAGLTPVHLATKEGSIDVLKFLFQMGANKNCADSCSGRTPLHYAVESQNFEMCNFLLENGCNVNAVTFSGNTPLHVAAGRRLKDIVAVLMAYGANPAIANGEGDFPSDLPASLLMQRAKMNAR